MQDSFIQLKFNGGRVETHGAPQTILEDYYARRDALFNGWVWNSETLTVTSDRYGFQPLFYVDGKNSFAVSTSLVQLLELSGERELNPAGLAVFLRLGFFINDETAFKHIKVFPPNSHLTIKNNGERIWQREDLPVFSPVKLERREIIEIYAELFSQAMEKMPPDDESFVVPISGGRDSRHILLDLCAKERKPRECLTLLHYPPRPDEDAQVAARLCQALNVKHTLIRQFNSRLQAEIEKNLLTHFCADEHGWYLPMADYLKDNASLFYDGIAGDVLSAGLFLEANLLQFYREEKYRELAESILGDEGYLPRLLGKRFYESFSRELAVESLILELKRHRNAANPVGSFYFWNRTRREIALAPFGILGKDVKVFMPYLEPALFDFLSSIPAEDLLNKQLHSETIAFAYPKFADVSYESKKAAPNLDYKHFRQFNNEIVRYAFSPKKTKIVSRNFLVSRYLRSLLDKNYSESVVHYSPLAIYLLQLEGLLKE